MTLRDSYNLGLTLALPHKSQMLYHSLRILELIDLRVFF